MRCTTGYSRTVNRGLINVSHTCWMNAVTPLLLMLKCEIYTHSYGGKHLNEVQKAFIEVMEELEINSTHPFNPLQLIERVFDAINYSHSGY